MAHHHAHAVPLSANGDDHVDTDMEDDDEEYGEEDDDDNADFTEEDDSDPDDDAAADDDDDAVDHHAVPLASGSPRVSAYPPIVELERQRDADCTALWTKALRAAKALTVLESRLGRMMVMMIMMMMTMIDQEGHTAVVDGERHCGA